MWEEIHKITKFINPRLKLLQVGQISIDPYPDPGLRTVMAG
jgi:hypothetical protein